MHIQDSHVYVIEMLLSWPTAVAHRIYVSTISSKNKIELLCKWLVSGIIILDSQLIFVTISKLQLIIQGLLLYKNQSIMYQLVLYCLIVQHYILAELLHPQLMWDID